MLSRLRLLRRAVWLPALALPLGCGVARESAHDGAQLAAAGVPRSPAARDSAHAARVARARTAHVIIVSIDGLRPDAIMQFGAATLLRLEREGRYATNARTIVPSTTIPSHASMLSGVGPLTHHVLWNGDHADDRPMSVPSVFAFAKREGLTTAAFYSKSKFAHLIPPGVLDTEAAPDRAQGIWSGARTATVAARYLADASPSLTFVHVGEPDYAGHEVGWMSDEYADAVRMADHALDLLLAHADSAFGRGSYTVIVTADHGGHGRTHGTPRAVDTTIPWIVWGEGVQPGAPLSGSIRTMDTAATALWLLGIEVPASMAGRPVTSAFVGR